MKTRFILLIFLSVLFSCADNGKGPLDYYAELDSNDEPNTITKQEKKKGWELLFDGETTEGWRGYNMNEFPDSWTIEDAALTMTTKGKGESLDIITEKEYRNFVLSLEYKVSEGANSGILFQIKEDPKYKYPYETGPEFQIIDHENWQTSLEDWQISGANYAMYPPAMEKDKEVGEWNRLLLMVDDNKVFQVVNGDVVVEYEKYSDDWKERKNSGKWVKFPDWGKFDLGHISLQNHGSRVWFRDIKIKTLD